MKTISTSLLLVTSFLLTCSTARSYKISDQDRKAAVLTDTYGVLNQDDIDIYAWKWNYDGLPPATDIQYWICAPTLSIRTVSCRDFGYDSINKEHNAELDIVFSEGAKTHDIGARRALDIQVCRQIVNDVKNLIKGESHFCAGAGYSGPRRDGRDPERVYWIYDKFKTKKGCISYFGQYCDPNYWKKFGYPIAPYGSPDYPHP